MEPAQTRPQLKAVNDNNKSNTRLKLDVGFKSLLRGMRKHLRRLFDKMERKGKHHWDTQKWYDNARNFLETDLKLGSFSERDVWACVLLLYPAFGPSHNFKADESIETKLGKDGILIYKEVFDKNREKSRAQFL
jgi:hypothetical protein